MKVSLISGLFRSSDFLWWCYFFCSLDFHLAWWEHCDFHVREIAIKSLSHFKWGKIVTTYMWSLQSLRTCITIGSAIAPLCSLTFFLTSFYTSTASVSLICLTAFLLLSLPSSSCAYQYLFIILTFASFSVPLQGPVLYLLHRESHLLVPLFLC